MRKNEADPTKRLAGPIPFVDGNGQLLKNQTFLTASAEVFTYRRSTNDWIAAAANTTELGGANTTGTYLLQFSQAETNYDSLVGVKLVKAGQVDQFWFEKIDNGSDVNVASWKGVVPRDLDNMRVDVSIGEVQTLASDRLQSAVAFMVASTTAIGASTVTFTWNGHMGDTAAIATAGGTLVGMTISLHNRAQNLTDGSAPQTRTITAWVSNGATGGTATVDRAWSPTPTGNAAVEGDYQIKLWPAGSIDLSGAVASINAHSDVDMNTVLTAIAGKPTAAQIRDAVLDTLLSDHSTIGSVADGIALAAGLLQGNFFIDNTVNTNSNGQTQARMRLFRSSAAVTAATAGGSGQGEFATFNVETTYVGPNQIQTHRVTRQ